MSLAPPYSPTASFANDETNQVAGRSTVRTVAVDTELANISTTVNALKSNLEKLQRDDDKLMDFLVEPYALAEQTRALIAAGGRPRGLWAAGQVYAVGDVVQQTGFAYQCYTAHTATAPFTANGFWISISGDGSAATNAAAAAASEAAATAAAAAAAASVVSAGASATAAAASVVSAGTSATAAGNSATAASASAAAAAVSVGQAATSESASGASAIAAAASAAAAAASAAALTLPVPIANGGTGSTTATGARTALGLDSLVVPAGAVSAFARNSAPTGWLKANGALVSRATYAALFSAIGTTFGVGDGSTTFGLPDLRGEFIRGWDDSRGVDSGRVFGSAQLDAFQGHVHRAFNESAGGINGGGAIGTPGNSGLPLTDGTNGTPRTAAETRPRNIAMIFCIKF